MKLIHGLNVVMEFERVFLFVLECTDEFKTSYKYVCESTHTHTNTQSNTSLAAFHDSTLNYSELRCSAAKAQSTPRQLGSRKQYKIDMHVPLCFSEVCGGPQNARRCCSSNTGFITTLQHGVSYQIQ